MTNDNQPNNMTFDRKELLKSKLQSLGFALRYFNLTHDIETMMNLLQRLNLLYQTDSTLDDDCVRFLNAHTETMKRFDDETL